MSVDDSLQPKAPDSPQSAPAPNAAASEPKLLEVACPGCGAQLRNVVAGTEKTLRCLNCGKRFEYEATQVVAAEVLTSERHRPALAREPKSPGYWLLRIPGKPDASKPGIKTATYRSSS